MDITGKGADRLNTTADMRPRCTVARPNGQRQNWSPLGWKQQQTAPEEAEVLAWSRQDAFFIGVTLMVCVALLYRPVLQSIGGPVLVFLSVFAMLNPFSAVLYLAASQTLADAPGLAYTPAQLSAVGFAIALLFRKRWVDFPAVFFACLKWIAPFLFYFAAKRVLIWNSSPVSQSDLLALSACVIAAIYYRDGAKNRWLWFFCLCIGALIGIAAFVFHMAGLEAMVVAGAQGTRERLYVGRAANATSIGLVAGIGGMLALWLSVRMRTLRIAPERLELPVRIVMLALCWLALLTVFATGSRAGAIGSIIVIGVALVAALILTRSGIQTHWTRLVPAIVTLILGGIVMVVLPQAGLRASFERILTFSEIQAREQDVSILVAGRSETWYPALMDFLDAPILGVMPGQPERTTYSPHNVFISAAKGFGVVGLALYLVYFCGPTWYMCRKFGIRLALPFALFLLGIFLIFNSLDFSGYKTFHVYNGIVIGLILEQKLASKPSRIWQQHKNW